MDLKHELIVVEFALISDVQALIEQVHDEGFAAPRVPPKVNTLHSFYV